MKGAKKYHKAYRMKTPDVNITNRVGVLYHITKVENVKSILEHGLNSSAGLIWFSESMDKKTILTLAITKRFDYNEFVILEINKKGVTGFITIENFTGSTHKHIYVKQDLIKPRFIKVIGAYSIELKNNPLRVSS